MGRSFWLLWTGQAISSLGDAFGTIAMGWAVYELTGSKLAMGSLALTILLPQIVIWIFGGPLIDRFNRRHLMLSLDVVRMLAYLLPPVLIATGHLALWHLYALSFAEGVCGAMFYPAYLSLVPSIVAPEQLVRANSLSMGSFTAMNMLGPTLAGMLVAGFGSGPAMLVDAASFAVSAVALLAIPAALGKAQTAPEAQDVPYLKQLSEGYRFFGRVPALLWMMIFLALANMGGQVRDTMVIPWVREQVGGGANVLGILEATVSLGMLAGTLVAGWRGEVKHRRLAMLAALAGTGLMQAGMGLVGHGQVAVALGTVLVMGFIMPFWDAHSHTIYQKVVPDELRGRVMSVRLLVGQGIRPIGAFFGALLADRSGLPVTLVLFGLLPALAAIGGMFMPSLRWIDGDLQPVQMDETSPVHQSS